MQKGFAAVLGSLIGVLVIRFGKEIPESSGSVRWEISRPSPTRSRREEGDECRQVGPACQPARERGGVRAEGEVGLAFQGSFPFFFFFYFYFPKHFPKQILNKNKR